MPISAPIPTEILLKLKSQRRKSMLSSLLASLLFVTLLCLLFALILLPSFRLERPDIVTYQSQSLASESLTTPQVPTRMQRQPSSPSLTMARVIAANSAKPMAIPVPEATEPIPAVEFGSGDNFGEGWGDGSGAGSAGGGFGTTGRSDGLEGRLYDFKQTPAGQRRENYDPAIVSHFTDRIIDLQRSRYRDSALRDFYRSEQALSVSYIAIPNSNANEGPKFFRAENEVEPRGWIVHYRGSVVAPKSGTFRFVGSGDDYLAVMLGNQFRLVAGWPDIADRIAVRGANARKQGNVVGPFNIPLTYGDWFTVRKGQELAVNIILGERPGGMVGYILMLEEQGVNYRKDSSGRDILPPFAVSPLSGDDILYLEEFPGWEWEHQNVPIFHTR